MKGEAPGRGEAQRPLFGVNLPTLLEAYGHDLAPNERHPDWGAELTPMVAFRYLSLCRILGFDAVRMWLCEDCEGIHTDRQGRPIGVVPELLDAIDLVQDGARIAGLRLYWTLLDANSWERNGDELVRGVFAQEGEALRFAETVAAPIAARLDPELTFGLEVVNEPESLSVEVAPTKGLPWEPIARAVGAVRGVIHQARPDLRVTAGTQAVFLPGLLAELASGGEAPVDAVDLHVYHPDGGLPSREELAVDIGELPLWAGECGLSSQNDPERSEHLIHYLYNARALGYEAAFLWRLEGAPHLVERRERWVDGELSFAFDQNLLGDQVQDFLRTGRDGQR